MRPVLDVDPFDPEVLAEPAALHDRIRELAPAVWVPARECWMVGRDEHVREVLTDYARFTSAAGTGLTNLRREPGWRKPSAILEVDPPDHDVTRRVLGRLLAPSAIAELRAGFETTAHRLVAEAIEGGTFDAAELSFRFPFTVLPDAVGLPAADRHHLVHYGNLNFNAQVPDTELTAEARTVAEREGSFEYVRRNCERGRLAPGGFGARIYEAADRGEIDEETAGLLVRTFLSAGIDTTIHAIGMTILELARRPDAWAAVRSDPTMARKAFEETLRLRPSSPVIGRTTTGPTALGDVELGDDEKVICLIGAANRDPRRWDEPDEWLLGRRTAGHLAFGLGVHFCVGAPVARLEAECLLGALAEQVVELSLDGPVEPVFNNWLNGCRSIPVRVRAA